MATVFRPPIVARQVPLDRGPAIRSQSDVTGINLNLRPAVQGPGPLGVLFFQTDWPVPKGPNPGPVANRTWTASKFPPPLPTVLPFNQYDWPVPAGRLPGVITNRTWTAGPQPVFVPGLPPIRQYDWPVPPGPRRSVELLTWLHPVLPIFGPPIPSPFYQTDWPVPRGPVFPVENRIFTSSLHTLLLPLPPIRQFDWPVPRGAASMVWRIHVDHNLLTTTLVPPATSGLFDFWHYYSP